jgi:hypothetical protein
VGAPGIADPRGAGGETETGEHHRDIVARVDVRDASR